jgi:hypothetical protein
MTKQRREGEANSPQGQRPARVCRGGPSWTEFVRLADQAVVALVSADLMAICHDARKGRYNRSHWSKPARLRSTRSVYIAVLADPCDAPRAPSARHAALPSAPPSVYPLSRNPVPNELRARKRGCLKPVKYGCGCLGVIVLVLVAAPFILLNRVPKSYPPAARPMEPPGTSWGQTSVSEGTCSVKAAPPQRTPDA